MLSFIDFQDKKSIILDKWNNVYVMNRRVKTWRIITIPKNTNEKITEEFMGEEEAYELYSELMESFGFKKFPVFTE